MICDPQFSRLRLSNRPQQHQDSGARLKNKNRPWLNGTEGERTEQQKPDRPVENCRLQRGCLGGLSLLFGSSDLEWNSHRNLFPVSGGHESKVVDPELAP